MAGSMVWPARWWNTLTTVEVKVLRKEKKKKQISKDTRYPAHRLADHCRPHASFLVYSQRILASRSPMLAALFRSNSQPPLIIAAMPPASNWLRLRFLSFRKIVLPGCCLDGLGYFGLTNHHVVARLEIKDWPAGVPLAPTHPYVKPAVLRVDSPSEADHGRATNWILKRVRELVASKDDDLHLADFRQFRVHAALQKAQTDLDFLRAEPDRSIGSVFASSSYRMIENIDYSTDQVAQWSKVLDLPPPPASTDVAGQASLAQMIDERILQWSL
jgi:hypothetical protein